jgi:Spy/CpxP family protein refolding chaperone
MRNKMIIAILAVGLMMPALAAAAGPTESPACPDKAALKKEAPGERQAEQPGGPGHPQSMIEVKAMMMLVKELELTPEQAAKFYAAYNQMAVNRRQMQEKTRAQARKIEELLGADKKNDKALKAALDELDKVSREFRARQDKLKAELKGILTLEQQAKFVVMTARMTDRMGEAKKRFERHGMKPGEKGERPGGGPGRPVRPERPMPMPMIDDDLLFEGGLE